MAHKRLLVTTQLSNYDSKGTWILECDSGFQMVMGRIREMLKLNPELNVDVVGPCRSTLRTQPDCIVPELFDSGRVKWIEIDIVANALATRYEFNITQVAAALRLSDPEHVKYDAVYINDPMLLRHYKALFLLYGKYRPRFFVHSHFVDVPECPKFPTEASLWLGQCEAAIRADYNFWQCESAMKQFFESMSRQYRDEVVEAVKAKSSPWDDGYSREEITSDVSGRKNVRFDPNRILQLKEGGNKVVVFVPNRIGGKGRSSDYTNCGKFMFELLPQLRKRRQDFVVVCGNPSQKILNHELEAWCGKDGYVSLVPDAFTRDEFKLVAEQSDIALGLYDQDTYGGTAARECVELGCMPLWLDVNEYSSIAREADVAKYVLVKEDFSDLVTRLDAAIGRVACPSRKSLVNEIVSKLQFVIRSRCSYESTTPVALEKMGLL